MGLNPRQVKLYKYTVDIWRQSSTPGVNSGVVSDFGHYPVSLISSDVACYFDSTPETDQPTAVGRNKQVNIFTLDIFHFETSVDIADTDYLIMKAAPASPDANPLIGMWWAVQGGTRTHSYRANMQEVYAKRSEIPAGAEGHYL